MRVVLAYICLTNGNLTHDFAAQFVGTYLLYPPGAAHETVVVCNGGPPSRETGLTFLPLQPTFLPRANDPGWDISAYQEVAAKCCQPGDMLVCFGESVYFHREDWLGRLARAWAKHGPGFYGLFSSGILRPHLNTTAFVISPELLLGWKTPQNHFDRYEFEHGERSFWKHVQALNRPVKLVTFDGEYSPPDWRKPANILWRGTQRNCLAFCNHTDRFWGADPDTRAQWSRAIDRYARP